MMNVKCETVPAVSIVKRRHQFAVHMHQQAIYCFIFPEFTKALMMFGLVKFEGKNNYQQLPYSVIL